MAIYKLNRETKEETIENKLQNAINLGKREALKEVIEWLDETTIDDTDGYGHPIVSFIGFEYRERMIQLFKERFNID